jgi:hypothetical protein
MRLPLTLGAALWGVAFLGCAGEPIVTTQDFKAGSFTVCGSPKSNMDALGQKAAQVCSTQVPEVVRCSQDVSYTPVGIQGAVPTVGNCCDYACPPALMRQAELLPPDVPTAGAVVAFSQ